MSSRTFKQQIGRLFENDWFLGILLLATFLLTNGYKYAWDDQHLEIPLLKSLIDPTLYVGDYYVESLKHNFTSYFYPLLARIISTEQIPGVYLILYLISRYFFFTYLYKLWKCVSQDRLAAFCAVAALILVGRIPEFLYRTFSHQEFALAIVVAGLYYFYRERLILAAVIFGFAANFHALYSLFPMIYLSVFLLLEWRRFGLKQFVLTGLAFVLSAAPFLIWMGKKLATPHPEDPQIYENWLALYQITCPQNFIFLDIPIHLVLRDFKVFLMAMQKYLLVVALFVLNWVQNETFRKDRKILAVTLTTFFLGGISFYFTYVQPNRFILDLNLVRNFQYLLLFLMGYTTLFFMQSVKKGTPWLGASLGLVLLLLAYGETAATLAVLFSLLVLQVFQNQKKSIRPNTLVQGSLILLSIACLVGVGLTFLFFKYKLSSLYKIVIAIFLLTVVWSVHLFFQRQKKFFFTPLYLLIPIFIMFAHYVQFHRQYLNMVKEGVGFWKLQADWEDMQIYVKENTPKDALMLIPNDMEMGGFRIGSERKVICCYRDCGIIGFDYPAAIEWQNRLKDIEAFKVKIDKPIKPAIMNALLKYRADYIVFMRYYAPPADSETIQKMYENQSFSLFQVTRNSP